ncbi:T9SS type A sorting domain-containing protein, partial [candidate division WOR-3 bacterium]|nr:T9SS type A sorting domain-containing protein [candidate division WOR-3 bacterium]
TVLSPLLIPNPGMDWLKYGLAYNFLSTGEYLEAGIKYFDGATWTVVPLKTYTADFDPAWDSVDVSAYAGYPNVQIYFFYTDNAGWNWYGAFDNVSIDATVFVPDHDVGCIAVASPPAGPITPGDIDVIGQIHNFGENIETFDVTAGVWDTTGGAWIQIFDQTITLIDFPVGGDSLHNFGACTFGPDAFFYTEIFTDLPGDADPFNDTAFVYSWTALVPGDVIFELDAEAITGDIRLLGVEFDGEYFYCTGASDYTQTWVYVIDTSGTLISSDMQPAHSTGWGWRDIAWDGVYVGPDRIDTLYSSVDGNVDKWGYDFVGDSLIYHGFFDGPISPNRALAYDEDDNWFFTASFSGPCYKFDKTDPNIMQVANPGYAMYGAAYDNGYPGPDGPWVWWHSQDDPGTGLLLQIEQMEPIAMTWTGVILAPVVTMSASGTAGGLSYWTDFRGMDVLFGMNQGTPDHIYGIFLRWTQVDVEEQPVGETPLVFGLNKIAPNPVKDGATVTYTTTKRGPVSLKVYDSAGRLVRTLIDSKNESAGYKTVYWDGTDDNHRSVAAGVYFYRLAAENKTASDKMIVIR